ncbi:MAG: hypothetical protein CMJ81_15550 [Planctomycetaceae bacterium]|nr:hypothetical protein [Planctomycetaceae bacterium]
MSRSPNFQAAVWPGQILIATVTISLLLATAGVSFSDELSLDELLEQYPGQILPLVQKYCVDCHSTAETKGELDLQRFTTAAEVRGDTRTWQKVLLRLRGGEMPPAKKTQPSPDERSRLIDWSEKYLLADARERAGDPGLVLIRRLTRAEHNYTIHELTGVDLRPARNFLEDSVAGEGFANTGEALFMAPELIPVYLNAARQVSAHAVLTPAGLRFSASKDPHSWVAEVAQTLKDLYGRYTDWEGLPPLTDYLEATLRYRERDLSANLTLEDFVAQQNYSHGRKLSPEYLQRIWNAFNEPQPTGVMAEVVRQWQASNTDVVKGLYDAVTHIEPANSSDPTDPAFFEHPPIPGTFDEPGPYGYTNATGQSADMGFIWNPGSHFVVDFGNPEPISRVRLWSGYGGGVRGANMEISFAPTSGGPYTVPQGGSFNYLTSVGGGTLEDGCKSPDTTGFYQYEFEPTTARYWRVAMVNTTSGHMPRTTAIQFGPIPDVVAPELTATITGIQQQLWKLNRQKSFLIGSIGLFGAHSIPLLDQAGNRRIDSDTYASFAELFPLAVCFAPVVPNNRDVTVELFLREDEPLSRLLLDDTERAELDRLWDELLFISRASVEELHHIKEFIGFQPANRIENTNKFTDLIPSKEAKAAAFQKSALAGQPGQLDAVIELADRAWRRPLSELEQGELRQLYELLRREQKQSHDAAIRTVLTRILVSPNFLYRVERPTTGEETVALTEWELASRLSYFLWSTMPDDRLRTSAAEGRLLEQEVLAAQTKRMLKDPKARALTIEFAGQWLQFRGFDEYDGKSETRFPTFTTDLRAAMNQETTDFVSEIIRNDRSVLEILQADYTFLNDELARHYNIPDIEGSEFRRVEGVGRFERGGIAAMGSVLTKQSGALRTSPVLRGTWVVDTLLGREIPNPPDDVPQLAEDEVNPDGLTMRERVERHRTDAACARCHVKIDPYGFTLEAYDPIGRLRDKDLNDNPIDTRAELENGETFEGLRGLQGYLLQHRDEFVKQFCRKLLGYALGRTVELSDEPLLVDMQSQLKENEHRFSAAVLTIVNSSQFRRHRGRNHPREISP